MLVGILCSRIRVEEKLLFEALKAHGTAYEKLDDRTLIFDLHDPAPFRKYDLILERAINHSRAYYALHMLNDWGIKTINTAHTARVCGDKLLTTQALRQYNLPVPRNLVAFTPESALEAIEQLGYPVVLVCRVSSFRGARASEGWRWSDRYVLGRLGPCLSGVATALPNVLNGCMSIKARMTRTGEEG